MWGAPQLLSYVSENAVTDTESGDRNRGSAKVKAPDDVPSGAFTVAAWRRVVVNEGTEPLAYCRLPFPVRLQLSTSADILVSGHLSGHLSFRGHFRVALHRPHQLQPLVLPHPSHT